MALILFGKATAHAPSSSEEEDILRRSSKKIRNNDEEWPKLSGAVPKLIAFGQTFAERLQGINLGDKVGNDQVVLLEIDPPSHEADPFPVSPPDPNAPEKPAGLLGKFWNGPDNVALDFEMGHEDFSDAFEDSLNCRGACGKDFGHQIRLVCRDSNPCLIFLSETKSESSVHFRPLEKLGFDGLSMVPSIGRSAGLAVAWKKDRISVSVLQSDRQFVHLLCSVPGMQNFYLIAVYSVPIPSLKERL
ncbi:hypothetical protein K1719_000568 [Acacia pycnantha]|nr:hypothetical protein K1719_000568 [Acacia pycnantha]